MFPLLARLAIKILPPAIIYLLIFFTSAGAGVDPTIATIIAAAAGAGTLVVTIRI